MPDLSLAASHEYWFQFRDPIIYRVVTFLEGVETWTYDGKPNIEQALTDLGNELDNIRTLDLNQLGHEKYFIKISNCIRSARVLRLLQAIDSVHPGSASKVLIYAEENSGYPDDEAGLFLRRNIVFERLRLISRVFAAERFKLIQKALEGESEDHE